MSDEVEAASIPSQEVEPMLSGGVAPFGRRVAARVIDWALSAVAWTAMCFGLWLLLIPHIFTRTAFYGLIVAVVFVPTAALFAYEWAGNAFGGTIGKRAVGIRVASVRTGLNAGLLAGLVRTLVAYVSRIALGLGYISAAWDHDVRTWHDKAARTVVMDAQGSMAIDHRGRVRRVTPMLMGALTAVAILFGIDWLEVAFAGDSARFFRVEGKAMEPTYSDGESIPVVKHRSVARGDIIVFRFPMDPSRDFIKRVIGMPGDTVEIRNEKVYVDGKPLVEDYVLNTPNYAYGPKTVPPGDYFVLGDNRRNSYDSHAWANMCPAEQQCDFVPKENIIGQALR